MNILMIWMTWMERIFTNILMWLLAHLLYCDSWIFFHCFFFCKRFLWKVTQFLFNFFIKTSHFRFSFDLLRDIFFLFYIKSLLKILWLFFHKKLDQNFFIFFCIKKALNFLENCFKTFFTWKIFHIFLHEKQRVKKWTQFFHVNWSIFFQIFCLWKK